MHTIRRMTVITHTTIREDIAAFQQRKDNAINLLLGLPASASTWKDKKKLKQHRHRLKTEISHAAGLIDMAERSLAGEWD